MQQFCSKCFEPSGKQFIIQSDCVVLNGKLPGQDNDGCSHNLSRHSYLCPHQVKRVLLRKKFDISTTTFHRLLKFHLIPLWKILSIATSIKIKNYIIGIICFNPFTTKISLLILIIVNHTILMSLGRRISYWIN